MHRLFASARRQRLDLRIRTWPPCRFDRRATSRRRCRRDGAGGGASSRHRRAARMERRRRHSQRPVAKPAAGLFDRRATAARRLSRNALDVAAGTQLPGPVDQACGTILYAVSLLSSSLRTQSRRVGKAQRAHHFAARLTIDGGHVADAPLPTLRDYFSPYAGPLGMSENRVSHATGPMLAATINSAASAPSSKLPRLAYW